jgi:hypothetical protein
MKPKLPVAVKKPTTNAAYLLLKIRLEYGIVTYFQLACLITHIEAMNGKLCIYLLDHTTIVSDLTITDILAMLPSPQFAQCHQSYIINAKHITKHTKGDGGELIINGKYKVPISRPYTDSVVIAMNLNNN